MVASVRRDSRIASAAARRSPRTRVRSAASMATSVPVPMARPRSAWASAAASFTPSPTMATTRPSACSPATTATLSSGSTSAITSSMPTSAATDRATACVVAGQQDRGQPQGAQPADRLGAGRLDRVGDHEHGPGPAVPADRDRGAAGPLGPLPGRVQLGGQRLGPVRQQLAAARPRRGGPRPRPGPRGRAGCANWSTAGSGPASRSAAAATARPIGCSEACSTAPASRSAWPRSTPAARCTATRRHAAGGDGAGLVQHDGVDRRGSTPAPPGP